MSTISDYVIFLLKAPYLLTTRFSLLAKAIVATLILVAVVLFPLISKPETLDIPPFDSNYFIYALVLAVCIIIVSRLWIEFNRKIGFENPTLNPNYSYATPTDIMNNLREDDKNSLMFGRSNNPTEPFTQNSGKSETLRGYMNSSTMGEQYGTFTGMTLYGGPEMYHQTDILKVFPKYNKYTTSEKIDLRRVPKEIQDKIDAYEDLIAKYDEVSGMTTKDREKLNVLKKDIFKALLEQKNEELEKFNLSDEEKEAIEYKYNLVTDEE